MLIHGKYRAAEFIEFVSRLIQLIWYTGIYREYRLRKLVYELYQLIQNSPTRHMCEL